MKHLFIFLSLIFQICFSIYLYSEDKKDEKSELSSSMKMSENEKDDRNSSKSIYDTANSTKDHVILKMTDDDKRIIERNRDNLNDSNYLIRKETIKKLGMIESVEGKEKISTWLIAALKDKIPEVREEAAYQLGKLKIKKAVGPLIISIEDEHDYVSHAAIMALAKIDDSRTSRPIIRLLVHPDPVIRGRVAWLMGEIGDKYVIPRLRRLLTDDDYEVRIQCALALEKLGYMKTNIKNRRRYVFD